MSETCDCRFCREFGLKIPKTQPVSEPARTTYEKQLKQAEERQQPFLKDGEVNRQAEVLKWRERALNAEEKLSQAERNHLQTIDERDEAEDALGDAYVFVTGNAAEWSNLFGYDEATNEIAETLKELRDAAGQAHDKGWNEAIEAAAKMVPSPGKAYAIRKLRKVEMRVLSMNATKPVSEEKP